MTVEFLLQSVLVLRTLAVGLLTFTIVVVLPAIYKWYKKYTFFQSLPGETNYSIFYGNLHNLPKTSEGRIAYGRRIMEKYGGRFSRFWASWNPAIVLYHPDLTKQVFKSSAPKSRGFGAVYEHVVPWTGEGLLISNGERWARSRRLLTPAFHFDVLKQYMSVYNECVDTLFEKLDSYAESGEMFDICPIMTLCTLEIILRCAMSYDGDIQKQGNHPYAAATKEIVDMWSIRARTPWLWPNWIFKLTSQGRNFFKKCDYVHSVAENVIAARRKAMEKDGSRKRKYLDFLDILLTAKDEDGQPMTELEIRNEVDTFMFAGHDTTFTAATWVLYTLSQHPDYQKRVQQEIDEILQDRDTDDIQINDLHKMNALTMCIKEALRLFPPVPFIQRIINEDLDIDGHSIPKGTAVTIPIIHICRNKLVWEEPDKYNPERFTADNIKDKDSFAFTPFSAGSRNCIGQNFAMNEEKVIIARILRRYEVKMPKDAPEVLRRAGPVLRAENGLWFTLKRRF